MAIAEERFQILLPRALKQALLHAARRQGVSAAEYVRRLVEAELRRSRGRDSPSIFPFGDDPIRTGRRRGSLDHDRPAR